MGVEINEDNFGDELNSKGFLVANFDNSDYDEDVYLTDGNYVVQYVYTEDELPIAATGIFQDLYVFYFVVFSSAGIVLVNWLPRRRRD